MVVAVVLISCLVFVAIHLWMWRRVERDFNRAFKLSRGVAALLLTGLGFAGLIAARDRWEVGFLYRNPPGDWMLWGVAIAYGHLLSDFVWMAVGRVRLGIRPRGDLLIHHGMGLLAYGLSLALGIGYAAVLATLASEIMPCCTGLEALGKRRGSSRMEALARRGRLLVLTSWRIPLWGFITAMLVRTVANGDVPEGLGWIFGFALFGFGFLCCLDTYWVKKCLASALAAPKTEGGLQPSSSSAPST